MIRKSSISRFDPDEAFLKRESHGSTASARSRLECVSEEGEAPHPPLPTPGSAKPLPPYTFKSVSASYAASLANSTRGPFRRAFSEGAVHSSAAIHNQMRRKKKRSLCSALLWPWIKLKDGYVSCMMGFEGSGDLSGMSKFDYRSHGWEW